MNKNLFKNIKKAREAKGLSQKQLGLRLNVSDKTISAYEQGRAIPPIHTLKRISEITSKPLEFFFSETSQDNHNLKNIESKLDIIIQELKIISEKL
jgi:transcriptional regulator with XRE-family HTH domain